MTREKRIFPNYNNGVKYIVLRRGAARVPSILAHENTDTVAQGQLSVKKISKANCVTLIDFLTFVEGAQ